MKPSKKNHPSHTGWSRKICIISCYIFFVWIMMNLLDLRRDKSNIGSIILRDRHGVILTQKGLRGGYMRLYTGSLENRAIRSIIQIEDQRFFNHHGVDIIGKLGAIQENLKAQRTVRGGSTITEQYIKNQYYGGYARTYFQKFREASNALFFELFSSKEAILRNYLNVLYFGNGIYGLQTALDEYSDEKDILDLTENEILDLIDHIQNPGRASGDTSYKKHIAERLGFTGVIVPIEKNGRAYYQDMFPILTNRILQEQRQFCNGETNSLEQFLLNAPERSSLCNTQSLDITLSIEKQTMDYGASVLRGILGPLEEENVKNAAIYILDPEKNKVLVYLGNRDTPNLPEKNIDMIQEKRSVGSTLKPLIYLLALKNGADSENLVLDSTRAYPTGQEGKYFIPQNYNPKSYGPVRFREALGNSLNSASVRITETIGLGKVYDFLRGAGVQFDHDVGYYGYGLPLGTVELTLENLVHTYTSLLHMEESESYLLAEILKDPSNRAKTFGISSVLNTSIPLPVKTGTSTDFRDNWAISYHPHAIIGVWVGNSDGSPMEDVSGVSGAGPIWKKMSEYLIDQGIITQWNPPVPKGIYTTAICLDTNCLRQEIRKTKQSSSPKSRIRDQLYFSTDFYGILTEQEKKEWKIQ